MRYMGGNEAHRGKGVQGVWGIWAMRPTGAMGTGGMGLMAMRPTGGMGYRGMGHMGNRGTGGMGYRGMGHIGNGVQGYGQLGTGVWAIGHMGNGAHGRFAPKMSKRCQVVKKMSSCQKDVKCRKIKHLDYRGGSQKIKLT